VPPELQSLAASGGGFGGGKKRGTQTAIYKVVFVIIL